MSATSACKAKDPAACPYHGALLRAETAIKAGDTLGYLNAVDEAKANRNHKEPFTLKGFIDGENRKPENVFSYDAKGLALTKRLYDIDASLADSAARIERAVAIRDARKKI